MENAKRQTIEDQPLWEDYNMMDDDNYEYDLAMNGVAYGYAYHGWTLYCRALGTRSPETFLEALLWLQKADATLPLECHYIKRTRSAIKEIKRVIKRLGKEDAE